MAPALRDLLRSTSSQTHERLHGLSGVAAAQDGTIERAAHKALLGRLCGLHRTFALTVKTSPERTFWLEHDLTVSGVDASRRSVLPWRSLFRRSASPESFLGAPIRCRRLGARGTRSDEAARRTLKARDNRRPLCPQQLWRANRRGVASPLRSNIWGYEDEGGSRSANTRRNRDLCQFRAMARWMGHPE